MVKTFGGDYRVMRVVLASSSPIDTLQRYNSGQYSILTFLDMLEMLDMKETINEDAVLREKAKQAKV